jgi:hypothetical protein
MPNAQCPMPNAQCPMPNAQCPMPNAHSPASEHIYLFLTRWILWKFLKYQDP